MSITETLARWTNADVGHSLDYSTHTIARPSWPPHPAQPNWYLPIWACKNDFIVVRKSMLALGKLLVRSQYVMSMSKRWPLAISCAAFGQILAHNSILHAMSGSKFLRVQVASFSSWLSIWTRASISWVLSGHDHSQLRFSLSPVGRSYVKSTVKLMVIYMWAIMCALYLYIWSNFVAASRSLSFLSNVWKHHSTKTFIDLVWFPI